MTNPTITTVPIEGRLTCTKCHKLKPVHAFYTTATNYYTLICHECRNKPAVHTPHINHPLPSENQPIPVTQRPDEKKCSRCHRYKPLTEYHRQSNTKDGRQSWCKVCVAAKYQQRKLQKPPKPLSPTRPVIAGMNYCTRCETYKPQAEFYARQRWCKACQSIAMRANYARRKQAPPPPNTLPTEKVCTKCGECKPLEDFPIHTTGKHGRHSWCWPCFNAAAAARAQRLASQPRTPIDPTTPRQCTKCNQIQPASAFYAQPERSDGLTSWCKACHATSARARYQRKKATT